MRRFTRLTVPAALCVTLLAVSPGLAGAAEAPGRPQAAVSSALTGKALPAQAIPGTEALLAQVQSLGAVGGVLKPVTDLLTAVLKSPDGKIPEADLTALKAQVDTALADLKKSLPPAPALPAPVPEVPVKPPVDLPAPVPELPVPGPPLPVPAPALPAPALPVEPPKLPVEAPKLPVAAPKLPVAAGTTATTAKTAKKTAKPADGPLDLVTGAIDKLKASIDALTKAAGPCGCSTDAKDKATSVVTDLVAALVALLTGAGLPGLPPLPVEPPKLPVPLP